MPTSGHPPIVRFLLVTVDNQPIDQIMLTEAEAADSEQSVIVAVRWGQAYSRDDEATASLISLDPPLICIQFISAAGTAITAFAAPYTATLN